MAKAPPPAVTFTLLTQGRGHLREQPMPDAWRHFDQATQHGIIASGIGLPARASTNLPPLLFQKQLSLSRPSPYRILL